MEVERSSNTSHQCVCLLLHVRPDGSIIKDKCYASAGPDEPFCWSCVESGHPEMVEQVPWSERRRVASHA